MALVVEDGTGLPNATTWATRAELIAWAGARGITIPDDDKSDKHLVLAMDYLALLDWRGEPVNPDQGTPMPRIVYVDDCSDDLQFPGDSVPAPCKRAQLMLATASGQGFTLLAPTTAGARLKRRKVGPMEREFFDGGDDNTIATVPGVDELLSAYIEDGGGSFKLTVARA